MSEVDLTKLIEYVEHAHRSNLDDFLLMSMPDAERDEIVLALRVLRVLGHPDCDEGYFTGTGKLVFRFNGMPARRLLDDAERLLGLAGKEAK